jgi:hypothetical protein
MPNMARNDSLSFRWGIGASGTGTPRELQKRLPAFADLVDEQSLRRDLAPNVVVVALEDLIPGRWR